MSRRVYDVLEWSQRPSGRVGLISTLIAVTTLANLVMVKMPEPLAEYDLSPILIYALGVLMNPLDSLVVIAIAQGIGTTIKTLSFGWPLVFIPGAMGVRGVEASLIGVITRKFSKEKSLTVTKVEVTAMIVGVIWETVGFTVADVILFGPAMATITLFTIVDAVFIPVAVSLITAIRRTVRVYRLT